MKPGKNNAKGGATKLPPDADVNALVALYNARRYVEAESRTRALLAKYPDFGFGWKLLGGALQMQGKDTLTAFQRVAELMPDDAEAHFNLGVVLKDAGRSDQAVTSYQRAVKLQPGHVAAHYNLGNALKELGQLDHAVASYRKAITIKPDFVDAHNNLGTALKEIGRLDDAVASYRKVIELKPDFAEAHSNLGVALKELGQFDKAVVCYLKAIELKPHYAEARNNMGTARHHLGQLDAALTSYRKAVEIAPDFAEAHNNMGTALKDLGRLNEAMDSYHRAIEIRPDYAEAHNNLGIALKERGNFKAALASYQRALQLKPNYAGAYNNMGNVLQELRQLEEAVESYRKAIEIDPEYAEAHSNLGIVLKDIGQYDAAEVSYRKALELIPDYVEAQTNLLFTLTYTDQTPEYYLEEARKYGRMVSAKVTSRFTTWLCADRPERLRVGIVSGDLLSHPVGYFLEGLLAHLDYTRIELVAYPTSFRADALTARIKPRFAFWKPISGLSDEAAARMIHADGVHVLLDLSGHTGHNRLPVFAWKPAPVQASWLGYWATTGVAGMDYFLADKPGVPETQRGHFSETVWYLPDTRLCFTAPDVDLAVAPLPATKNGYVTFGCFQNLAKVSDEVLEMWGSIFSALPEARLRWQSRQLDDPTVAVQTLARLQRHGINPARVALHGAVSREAYLGAHNEVDMILDTFPFTGGTTTCEALWMGVPTLTLAGNTLLSRQGVSMLTAAGLEDWIATSKENYTTRAVTLTNDLPKLAALRARLRAQALASPLFDASSFAGNFEAALWDMWKARVQSQ